MTKREARRRVLKMLPVILRSAVDNADGWAFDGLSDADAARMRDALHELADQLEMRAHRMRGPEDKRG